MTTLAPYDVGGPWEEHEELYRNAMLEMLERRVPGVRSRLDFVETATPVTLERYSQNTRGALYGWSNVPSVETTMVVGGQGYAEEFLRSLQLVPSR